MNRCFSIVLMLSAMLGAWAHSVNDTDLCEADLMFCVDSARNAITDVTNGTQGLEISHVAIYHRDSEGHAYALEAISSGVSLTPIDTFMMRCRKRSQRVLYGRVRSDCHLDVRSSVHRALSYLGRPYDFYFESGDSALYCSELVQLSFVDTEGRLILSPIPMSFHDDAGHVTPYWKNYYARVGREVPEGAPGTNPGELSRRKEIVILDPSKR